MPSKKSYEVVMRMPKDPVVGACVRAAWGSLGVLSGDIVEQESQKCRQLSIFCRTRSLAKGWRSKFVALSIKGVRIFLRVHDQDDWQTRWKKGWKPFALTSRVHVIPRFIEHAKCPRGKIPLYLDTTAAFGTGLHETTRFSAQLIGIHQGRFKTFLDIGTGTGILVAVALFSGASHTQAFDIDPDAIKVAQQNLKVNHLKCDVFGVCDVQHYKVRQTFDLVAANLVTHDLVAFKDKIISCVEPGGRLIISGISLKNMPLVRKNYNRTVGLKCLKIVKGKEWSAFLFERIA